MKNKLSFAILLLFCLHISLLTTNCFAQYPNYEAGKPQRLCSVNASLNSINLNLMLAKTPEERSRGLMFYRKLPEKSGMLFLYNDEQFMSFWMKNTFIPLDLVFFSKDLKVVKCIKNMIPGAYIPDIDLPRYTSGVKARFALELNSGSIDRFNIKVGDRLCISNMFLSCE